MLPDIIAEEPGIDRTGYELVGHLICHLDELEHTKSLRYSTACFLFDSSLQSRITDCWLQRGRREAFFRCDFINLQNIQSAPKNELSPSPSNKQFKTDSVQSSSNYLQKLFTKNLLTAR